MNRDLYGLGDYNTNQIKVLARVVQLEGANFFPILYRRPDAAPEAVAFIAKMPVEEVAYIIPDSFSGKLGPSLAAAMTIPQLREIGANGEEYLREAIKLNLKIARQADPSNGGIKQLADYIESSPAWQL